MQDKGRTLDQAIKADPEVVARILGASWRYFNPDNPSPPAAWKVIEAVRAAVPAFNIDGYNGATIVRAFDLGAGFYR